MPKSRVVRWLLLGLGGFALVLLAAALVAYLKFDPQAIGPKIAAQIEGAIGRKADLGKIRLGFFPAPAVAIGPVTIADAGGTGAAALRIEQVAVRVRPWPLLTGRVELGAVVIDGAEANLSRDRNGRWDFADILEKLAAKPPAGATGAPPAAGGPGSGFSLGVARASLRNSRVRIVDEAVSPGRRTELAIGPIDATVSGWGMGGGTSFDLSAGLGASVLRVAARLSGAGDGQTLDLEVPSSKIALADLPALLPWLGVARPDGLAVAGTVTVNGRASMPLNKVEAVRFQGTAAIDGGSYRDATLKRPVEKIGGTLKVDGDRAEFDDFQAVLGDSDLKGRLAIAHFLKPELEFALESSRLDLNQILETFSGGGAPASASTPAPGGGTAAGEGLLDFRARGSLAVRAMRFQTFDIGELRGNVRLERKVLALDDVRAVLYGGKLAGKASADLSGAVPKHRIEVSLAGLDVNGAATAYDAALKDLLRGSLSGELSLDAAGLEMDPILDTASGRAKLEIVKGSLTSISILKQLAALLEAAGGRGIGKDETPFESLRGTFVIGGRKAVTDDLTLTSADLDMTAQGSVGLDASLDLKAVPSLSADATKGMVEKTSAVGRLVDSKGRLTLHLTAKGNLAAPSIGLDLSAQTREARDKLKNEAEEEVKKKLKDKLKGLFNR